MKAATHRPEPLTFNRQRERPPWPYNILILGASYGSLLASKMLFGGHKIHHVCLPAEADLINAEGFRVRLPVQGPQGPGGARFAQAARQGDGAGRPPASTRRTTT